MDNHIIILGRWNILFLLWVLFFLSACGGEGESADASIEQVQASVERVEIGSVAVEEEDVEEKAPEPQTILDNSEKVLEEQNQNDIPSPAWGTAELIVPDDTREVFWPQVTLDKNGNALVVWVQKDDARTNIRANRFNGSAWSSAELIETDNAGDTLWPQVAFDGKGNALAVWVQSDGSHYNIWANRFSESSWGAAKRIETDNTEDAFKPQIAFDSKGNALALWGQYDGDRTNIWANRFNGLVWSTAELIETDNAGNTFKPQIAFDSSGSALAVMETI